MEKEELISLYFEGKLSEAQEITFQQLMETDADFAEEVRYQENVKKAITLNERKQLKATLQSFETEKKTTGSFTKWLAAASIALVMISTYWYFNQTPDHNSLYAAYYQAYPNVIAPTVRSETKNDLQSQAFYAYDNGDYKKSAALFSEIHASQKEEYAVFYAALSLMEDNKHEEAIKLFDSFKSNKESRFSIYAEWYEALCYLKLNNKPAAIKLLKQIANEKNPQQETAQRLLKELN